MSGQQVIVGPAIRESGPHHSDRSTLRRRRPATRTVTNTQTSRISFLSLVVMGALGVPLLAFSAGAAVFGGVDSGSQVASLVDAPPPVILVALGVLMVAAAVGRRHRKNSGRLTSGS